MPFVLFPYFYLHVYSESIQNKKDKRDVKSEPVYFQKISECLRTQFFFLPYLLRPSSFSSSTSTKSSSEHHDDSDSRVVVRPMEGSVKNMERCCYYKVQAVATVKKKKTNPSNPHKNVTSGITSINKCTGIAFNSNLG